MLTTFCLPRPVTGQNLEQAGGDRAFEQQFLHPMPRDAEGRTDMAFTYFRKAIKFVRFKPDWVAGA